MKTAQKKFEQEAAEGGFTLGVGGNLFAHRGHQMMNGNGIGNLCFLCDLLFGRIFEQEEAEEAED